MAKPKKKDADGEFVLFNVMYEDGAQSSNRKVPRAEMDGIDDDAAIRRVIEEQDRKIAEMSGKSRGPIKSIVSVGRK